MVQIDATTYQSEHCLFIIDSTVTWASPATAYNDVYAYPFTRLSGYFTKLTTLFPANYFSICYIANTNDLSHVPNYIDQTYKATGISTGLGSSGIGNGNPNAPQSFSTIDFCRYNENGNLYSSVVAVYDHELGHAWGAQFFNNVSGSGPGILSNGHWLSNTTIDCQMGASYSSDGGLTVDKIYGDPVNGFRYQRVDNNHSNDYQTFGVQTLYLIGVTEKFPTTYALNSPVYNADNTVTYSSVETYDQAAVLGRYGPRNPDYRTAPKQFKLGFVYIARDVAEVNSVYQAVETSVDQFCNGEVSDPVHFRFQTPFLVNTHFRASVDGRLADLDGVATPTLTVTDTYSATTDGSAVVHFAAADAAGPAPTVSLVPASTQCTVVGSTVQVTGLPDGVHFFSLKAVNAAGKRALAHFVVEVQRPVTSTAIATQPVTQTATAGNNATFSVVASGTGGYSYQWFRQASPTSTWNLLANGGSYSGATTPTLSVVTSTDMNGDQFLCTVTNVTGEATSQAATLVVNEIAPSLTLQPVDTAVPVGTVAHFTLISAGAPLTYGYSYYQWQKQTAGSGVWNNIADGAGVFIGTTTNHLTVYGTVVAMTGDQYRCLVSNTTGSTTSSVGILTVNQPPVVTTQPTNLSLNIGQTATFTVVATGTAPLTYQWQKYSTVIPGATSATLTLTNVQMSDIGSYGVKITNPGGFTYSNYASLAIAVTAPTITNHPAGQTVPAGSAAGFSVTATGTMPFTYQWTKNGTSISGATFSNYAIFNVSASDAGNYAVSVSNSAGTAISSSATLSVSPGILTPPQGASVVAGASVNFAVTAGGTGPLTYQWLKNGTPIGGATSATYSIPSAQVSDGGNYTVTVTNASGSATSVPATLSVAAAAVAPSITTQPQSTVATVGSGVSFVVAASGTAPLIYQWQKNGSPIPSATSSTYSIASVQLADTGSYSVVVTNSVSSVSSTAAMLTVNAIAPTITTQPQNVSVTVSSGTSFSVAASGTTPFTYQWSKGGVAIDGATSSSYTLASAQISDSGNYTVTVTNSAGFATSSAAALTVTAAVIAPSITSPPQNSTVTVGAPCSFTASASGTTPFTYQWLLNGTPISGATSATYAVTSALHTDAGNYSVIVTNAAGSATSASAALTVNAAPPAITIQPQPVTLLAGSGATFSVTASGTAPFTYQWSKNGVAIGGATAASFSIASVAASDAGNFSVTVTNAAGSVTSSSAALVVTAITTAPAITAQPHGATVTAGASVTLTVAVSGTAPFSFQWYKGVAAVSGATTASYAIPSAQPIDAGNYSVTVSNTAGFVTSSGASVVVNPAPPTITQQPQPSSNVAGGSVTFTATTNGTPPFTYQWFKNGVAIGGATRSSFTIGTLSVSDAGSYSVSVTNAAGSVTSTAASLTVLASGTQPTTLLANLSVRTTLATGQRLIPGFVTNGNKPLLLRVAGPTLTALGLGLSGYPDPVLQVYNASSELIDQNDNWPASLSSTFIQVGAFAFTDARDSALLTSLAGPNSAIVTGNGSGTVLMELYDTQTDYSNRLVNVSARNQVGIGADALILGFVISGTGTKQLLIRGIGPAFAHYGVGGFLVDPYLEVFNLAGVKINEVDNWDPSLVSTFTQVGAFALDANSKDAALLVTLPPGIYSVKLTGKNNTTGEGLVEVYEVWP